MMTSDARKRLEEKQKIESLAATIYAQGLNQRDFWLSTVDQSPNSASYQIARFLVEHDLAK